MNIRVLITGATGYIAGRLVQKLRPNKKVNLLLASRNDTMLINDGRVKGAYIDWNSPLSIQDSCSQIDVIIHLASLNSAECVANPEFAYEVNVRYSQKLFHAAQKAKVRKFIYASTAHVYGVELTGVITEESPTPCTHPYATTHLAVEEFLMANGNSTEPIILRLSNAFGAAANIDANCKMLAINDFCIQAVRDKRIILKSSPKKKRDFVMMSDVCTVIENITTSTSDASLSRGIYNLSSGYCTSLGEMAARVQSCCYHIYGYTPNLVYLDNSEDAEESAYTLSNSKISSIGFRFSCDFDREIVNTLRLYGAYYLR